jgi:hypothetical protein
MTSTRRPRRPRGPRAPLLPHCSFPTARLSEGARQRCQQRRERASPRQDLSGAPFVGHAQGTNQSRASLTCTNALPEGRRFDPAPAHKPEPHRRPALASRPGSGSRRTCPEPVAPGPSCRRPAPVPPARPRSDPLRPSPPHTRYRRPASGHPSWRGPAGGTPHSSPNGPRPRRTSWRHPRRGRRERRRPRTAADQPRRPLQRPPATGAVTPSQRLANTHPVASCAYGTNALTS